MAARWARLRWFAAILPAICATAPTAWGQYAPDKQTFKLRGQEYAIFPRDRLVARGLTPPEIPDDQNAAWVYIDAMNAFVEPQADLQETFDAAITTGTWPDGDAGNRLAEWLDKNADAIALTRKAAAMPNYYMPFAREGETDSLVAALFPTLGPMRNLSRLMVLSAAHARASNDPDSAVDDAIATQRMANHAGQGSTLIEGLVGLAIGTFAEKDLRRSIESSQLTADKLAEVGRELDKLAALQPDWERMMRGEEKLSEGHIDDILDLSGTLPGLLNPHSAFGGQINANPDGWERLARRLKRVYLPDRLMKQHSRAYFERLVAATRRDAAEGGLKETDEELMAAVPAWNMTSRMMLPSLSRTHDTTLVRRANFERTRVAVAAAAYWKAHGVYPPRLADLRPAYLSEIPRDPLTGRDMEYSVRPDGTPAGLEPIEGEKARAFYERRTMRAEARRAESVHPWRIILKEYTDRYQLDDAQRTAADAILRELEGRAAAYIKSLESRQPPDPAREQELTRELIRRLEDLPTAAQRAAARK